MHLPELSIAHRTRCVQLRQGKYRDRYGEILLEGRRIVEEALLANAEITSVAVTASMALNHDALIESLNERGIPVFSTTEAKFRAISDTRHSQGIAAVARKPEDMPQDRIGTYLESTDLVPMFERVGDPGNLGTIIRICDWFAIPIILITAGSVDLYNPKVIRATMGSIFRTRAVRVEDVPSLMEEAKGRGYVIAAADPHSGLPVSDEDGKSKILLLFGSEAHGLSSESGTHVDRRLTIRKYGDAESLNVAVSCGILFSQLRSARDAWRHTIVTGGTSS